MICVSIGRGRHRHVIAEHRHLVQQGAKLVELRIDYINGEANIKRLVTHRPGPVIITCRRPADGGKFAGTEDQRLMLLRTAIAEGVEYVDLEDDVAGKIPRFGPTKRIVSHHDFRKTPDNLEEIHRRLCGLGPGHRQDLHHGQPSPRQPADAATLATEQDPHRRRLHGRHRHAHPHPRRPVRFAVDLSPPSITSGCWPRASSASRR